MAGWPRALVLLLVVLLLGGCAVMRDRGRNQQATAAIALSGAVAADGSIAGGAVAVRAGAAGLEGQLELGVPRLGRDDDPRRFTGGEIDVAVRASPFGMLADDHRFDRYFDLGAQVGAGGGPVGRPGGLSTFGTAWYGAWLELGVPGDLHGKHVRLVGEVRRQARTAPYLDETVFVIGLAWASRRGADDDDFVPLMK